MKPGMTRLRLAGVWHLSDPGSLNDLHWSFRNLLVVEPSPLMLDVQGAIQLLLHDHPRGPNIVVDLIQSAVVSHGEVMAQGALGLQAQDAAQITPRGCRPVQICSLHRLHAKAPVLDRQIAPQEPIGFLHRLDPR